MSPNILRKLRSVMAKTMAAGCTYDEAVAAFEKACELIKKYGLENSPEFAAYIKDGKPEQLKVKGKKGKAKPKATKPVTDDGKLRHIYIVVGTDKRGRKAWQLHATVTHTALKDTLKALREQGKTVKSKVAK
jgi:hypothetical protein